MAGQQLGGAPSQGRLGQQGSAPGWQRCHGWPCGLGLAHSTGHPRSLLEPRKQALLCLLLQPAISCPMGNLLGAAQLGRGQQVEPCPVRAVSAAGLANLQDQRVGLRLAPPPQQRVERLRP